jgi:hypothetical protein
MVKPNHVSVRSDCPSARIVCRRTFDHKRIIAPKHIGQPKGIVKRILIRARNARHHFSVITPVRKAEQTDHSDQVNDGPNHESESQNALASGLSDKGNDQKHDRK